MFKESDWAEQVGAVFNPRPRVALNDKVSWIPRPEEKALANGIAYPGVNVCLDGPSGSGKTSLARTLLAKRREKGRHIYTRLSNSTTWMSFKNQLIEKSRSSRETDKGVSIKVGIKELLPYIDFSRDVGLGDLARGAQRAEIIKHLHIPEIADIH